MTTEGSCLCCFLSSKEKHNTDALPCVSALSLVQSFAGRAHGPRVHPAQCLLPTCRSSRALGTGLALGMLLQYYPSPLVQQHSAQGPLGCPGLLHLKIPEQTFLNSSNHFSEHVNCGTSWSTLGMCCVRNVPHIWFDLAPVSCSCCPG